MGLLLEHELETFHESYLAKEILKLRGPFRSAPEGLIYQYQKEGYWQLQSSVALQKEIYKTEKLGWFKYEIVGRGTVQARTIKPLLYTSRQLSNIANIMMISDLPKFEPNPGVALKNGFLTIGGLRENKPNNFAARYLNLNYRADARAPRFEKMLQEIFQKDKPEWAAEKISTLQKFFGACLFGLATRYSKALILLGAGANGKSTLQEIVEQAIFAGRSSSVHPTKWSREYYVAGLFNSDLNSVSELPKHEELSPDVFKAVISGEAIQGRLPKEKPFKFHPTAGHIFSANVLPQTDDTSEGFNRRVIIIPFTMDFRKAGNASKEDIAGPIIQEEREGILNWAFDGARAVVRDEGYSMGEWHNEALSDWRDESNTVRPFLRECTTPLKDARVSSAVLYEEYRYWCWQNGMKPLAKPQFGMGLNDAGVERLKSHGHIVYIGVYLKPRPEWESTKARLQKSIGAREIAGKLS